MSISIINKRTSTEAALEYFDRYRESFGNVISAKMVGNQHKVDYELTIQNDKGEEIVIRDCCSAGYWGEGPSGTYQILNSCGFDISKEFIQKNTSFKIIK